MLLFQLAYFKAFNTDLSFFLSQFSVFQTTKIVV